MKLFFWGVVIVGLAYLAYSGMIAASSWIAVNNAVDEIVSAGGDASGWVLDVADADGIVRVVGEVVARLGPVDILVNVAGVSLPVEITADEFERAWASTLTINLTAQARLIRACLPHLAAMARLGRSSSTLMAERSLPATFSPSTRCCFGPSMCLSSWRSPVAAFSTPTAPPIPTVPG